MDTIMPPIPGSFEWYTNNYANCTFDLDPHKQATLTQTVDSILDNSLRYHAVELVTHVPSHFIGALHFRESSFSWLKYLGNGDPLSERTTHVPAGRGPFQTWEQGGIDSLEESHLADVKFWSIPLMLLYAEKWNGLGYLKYHPHNPSPYLWSYTNIYAGGLYTSDHGFDEFHFDERPGVAAIFKEMEARGVM